MEVIIRPGCQQDISAVYALIKELAEYERAPDEVTNTVEDMIADGFGDHPCYSLLVAEVNGEIAGMAIYFVKYSTWKGKGIYLDDIIVTGKYRRRGIGTRLFKEVIRQAARMNARTLHWQVLDWNTPAIEFYKKYSCSIEDNWLDCKLTAEQITQYLS
jgi:GNAT superfamily N-acetyltransferase